MEPTLYPHDLLRAQDAWNRAYDELAATPQPSNAAALRRRLLTLSSVIFWHPFWKTERGRSPAARVDLRRRVRAGGAHIGA